MDYSNLINDNGLHLYNTDTFSSIKIKLVFNVEKSVKNLYTLYILSSYLLETNKLYKTVPKIETKIKELYNFYINSGAYIIGEKLFFSVNIRFLNRYILNDNYYEELLKFINDILLKPRYNKSILDKLKRKELDNIKRFLKDIDNKMYLEYFKYNFKDTEEYKYSLNNKEEIINIIKNITIDDLKSLHREVFNNFYKGLILGNVTNGDYNLIRKYIPFKAKVKQLDYYGKTKLMSKKKDYDYISDKTNISKIYLTYRFKDRNIPILDYVSNIMNSAHGPLFEILRSKYGLVYSFNYSFNYYERRILISGEIDKNNKDKFINGVDEAFSLMKKKSYVKKLLDKDKKAYEDDLYVIGENLHSLFNLLFEHIMKKYKDYDYLEFINNLDKVNEEDIISFINNIERTNIFFFKGELKDEQ